MISEPKLDFLFHGWKSKVCPKIIQNAIPQEKINQAAKFVQENLTNNNMLENLEYIINTQWKQYFNDTKSNVSNET